jgi:hypothetical protein
MYEHFYKFQKAAWRDINNPLCLLKKADHSLRDLHIDVDHASCQGDFVISKSQIIMRL